MRFYAFLVFLLSSQASYSFSRLESGFLGNNRYAAFEVDNFAFDRIFFTTTKERLYHFSSNYLLPKNIWLGLGFLHDPNAYDQNRISASIKLREFWSDNFALTLNIYHQHIRYRLLANLIKIQTELHHFYQEGLFLHTKFSIDLNKRFSATGHLLSSKKAGLSVSYKQNHIQIETGLINSDLNRVGDIFFGLTWQPGQHDYQKVYEVSLPKVKKPESIPSISTLLRWGVSLDAALQFHNSRDICQLPVKEQRVLERKNWKCRRSY